MKLYDHQKKIIEEDKPHAGLFMGTGSGKTRTALLLAVGRTLVIAPKTQFEDKNWEREIDKIPDKDLRITEFYVISKETFRKIASAWLKTFDTIIVDEAHTCLGVTPNVRWIKRKPIPRTSQLFEELGMYIMRTKPQRVYLCTATIIRNPMTVWGAGKLLGQKWDWYKFRDAYYIKLPMPGREVFVAKSDNETKDRLAKVVRKIGYTGQLSDYFDVPEQTHKTIFIELNKVQKNRIKSLPLEFSDPLVLLTKTHQVENGVLAGDEFNKSEKFESAKIEKILDLSIEFPRMVIFAKYIAQIEQIASALREEGKKVLTLMGATKERGKVILEANNSSGCIFIAQAQISSGWQLGKTIEHPEYYDYNCMIFASMDYSVVNRIQGEGRILRSDNLKKNLYIDLVTKGGIDEAVYKSINNKKDFNERIYLNL